MKRTIILVSLSVLCLLQTGWSQVPRTISYQGVLKDAGGNLINDSVNLAFSLWDVETGGTAPLWTESHSSVPVANGIFIVILGSNTLLDLDFDVPYWLEITVNGASLSPRTKLTAVPYSLTSQSVAGGTNIFPATGNVGIGTTTPLDKLTVAGNQPVFLLEHKGVLSGGAGGTTSIGCIKARDSQSTGPQAYINLAREGVSINATDLPTTIRFATTADGSSTAIERMSISNSGNVGIGTMGPTERLDVAGTVRMTGFKLPTGAASGYVLTSDASGVGTWQAAGSGAGWSLTGNSGTTAGTNFLGTIDDVPLELKVNGNRALRLEPSAESPNVIGGYSGNSVTGGVYGATIGGGGASGSVNEATGNYATVSGGYNNTASGSYYATVGGGCANTASGYVATVGGGMHNKARGVYSVVSGGGGGSEADSNSALGEYSAIGGGCRNTASSNATVGGGYNNAASGLGATVSGGLTNYATGSYATVSGGSNNTASGNNSTAMGYNSIAEPYVSLAIGRYNITDDNYSKTTWTAADPVFVIGNGTSTARDNAFEVRKDGSVYVNGTLVHTSDERLKTNINPLGSVLVKIDNIEPVRFEFKNKSTHPAGTHIGLIAQNIQKEFPELVTEASNGYLSLDYSHITAVNMQAIKELKAENDALKDQVKALQEQLVQLTARVAAIDESMALVPGE